MVQLISAICIQILTSHQRKDGCMGDYCDGTLFKTHPLFTHDELALQVTLYYDDLEVCNPLGAKAKIHKLGKSSQN